MLPRRGLQRRGPRASARRHRARGAARVTRRPRVTVRARTPRASARGRAAALVDADAVAADGQVDGLFGGPTPLLAATARGAACLPGMRWMVILLAACGAEASSAPRPSSPPATPQSDVTLPFDATWTLLPNAADVERGALVVQRGCTSAGGARRQLPLLSLGSHTIWITHANSECTNSSIAYLFVTPTRGRPLAQVPLDAGPRGGVARLSFEVASHRALYLTIFADGGRTCFGTLRVDRVVVR